jgi:hypothetical protein
MLFHCKNYILEVSFVSANINYFWLWSLSMMDSASKARVKESSCEMEATLSKGSDHNRVLTDNILTLSEGLR